MGSSRSNKNGIVLWRFKYQRYLTVALSVLWVLRGK